jgi:hypothetical protein
MIGLELFDHSHRAHIIQRGDMSVKSGLHCAVSNHQRRSRGIRLDLLPDLKTGVAQGIGWLQHELCNISQVCCQRDENHDADCPTVGAKLIESPEGKRKQQHYRKDNYREIAWTRVEVPDHKGTVPEIPQEAESEERISPQHSQLSE